MSQQIAPLTLCIMRLINQLKYSLTVHIHGNRDLKKYFFLFNKNYLLANILSEFIDLFSARRFVPASLLYL
jgi:hypothetical protein